MAVLINQTMEHWHALDCQDRWKDYACLFSWLFNAGFGCGIVIKRARLLQTLARHCHTNHHRLRAHTTLFLELKLGKESPHSVGLILVICLRMDYYELALASGLQKDYYGLAVWNVFWLVVDRRDQQHRHLVDFHCIFSEVDYQRTGLACWWRGR